MVTQVGNEGPRVKRLGPMPWGLRSSHSDIGPMCQKARSNDLGAEASHSEIGSKPTSWCLVSVLSFKVMSVHVNLLKSWPFLHVFPWVGLSSPRG